MFRLSIMTIVDKGEKWIEQVEALFMRYGIKSLTMNDVARELGISKKTLYQMVDSKNDLVVKVLEQHISREKAQCLNLAAAAPNAIEEIFIIMETNSQELTRMRSNVINDLQKYHRNGFEMIRKFQYDFVARVIRENMHRGRKEGLYRDDFDIEGAMDEHSRQLFLPRKYRGSGDRPRCSDKIRSELTKLRWRMKVEKRRFDAESIVHPKRTF